MFVIAVWCGAVPKSKSVKNQVEVWSKLGGNFLGMIDRPCVSHVMLTYQALRTLQDQASRLLKHPRRPPRYLVVFVGQTRLTSPSFPFVQRLKRHERNAILDVVCQAASIDVIYEDDDSFAKSKLVEQRLSVTQTNTTLKIEPMNVRKPGVLLPPELEVYNFDESVKEVVTYHAGKGVGNMGMFPLVEAFHAIGEGLTHINFDRLAQSTTLSEVQLVLKCRLDPQVGLMINLRELDVEMHYRCDIPTELGLLTNLSSLVLIGYFQGAIPSELGSLHSLRRLSICDTFVSSTIPSELCHMGNLTFLTLRSNQSLEGRMPHGLDKLGRLTYVSLEGSDNVSTGDMFSAPEWTPVFKYFVDYARTWER